MANLRSIIQQGAFQPTRNPSEETFGEYNQFQHIGKVLDANGKSVNICICRACSGEDSPTYIFYTTKNRARCGCDNLWTEQKMRCISMRGNEFHSWASFQESVYPKLVVKNAFKTDGRYQLTVICPKCLCDSTHIKANVEKGYAGCYCNSRVNQLYSYVHGVLDQGEKVAIKFGITNNPKMRVRQQSYKCLYTVEQGFLFKFNNSPNCLAAERECKQTLKCGVLTKEEMPDGWTETVSVEDLDKIISIYEKHGGKRIK